MTRTTEIALGVNDALKLPAALTLTQTGSISSNFNSLPYSGDVVTIGGDGPAATPRIW